MYVYVRTCICCILVYTRINSAGALLAGRGQYSTVKNGTRMRYGSAVGLLISAAVQMGGILLVLDRRIVESDREVRQPSGQVRFARP